MGGLAVEDYLLVNWIVKFDDNLDFCDEKIKKDFQ